MIRNVNQGDAKKITEIYNHYIRNTVITFEEVEISVAEMIERINNVESKQLPWLVAVEDDEIIGFAYLTPWKSRSAYRFSLEATVYLDATCSASGWGSKLYESLFDSIKDSSVHSVIGVIALPNEASIALHEKFGMEKVAHFREVGFKFEKWVDVGFWQVILNSD